MRNLLAYSNVLCQDAVDQLECLLLSFFFSFYPQLLITMEEAYLNCFATISLICTLQSMYPCQELNKAAHLPPDAHWQVRGALGGRHNC